MTYQLLKTDTARRSSFSYNNPTHESAFMRRGNNFVLKERDLCLLPRPRIYNMAIV
jgi:hypothetical protein